MGVPRCILIAVVILETVVIILLVIAQKRLSVVRTPLPPPNPLELAIDYESSDKKFEELVRQYRFLISARTSIEGVANSPILADCAILERTNYVRILIENGANVQDALRYLEKIEAQNAINLLRYVEAESKAKAR